MKMAFSALLLSAVFATSAASAASMTCMVGVYDGKALSSDAAAEKAFEKVVIPLDSEDTGDVTVKIGGHDVLISLSRMGAIPGALYSMFVKLDSKTEAAQGADYLYNEGEARDNGFSPDVRPGAEEYRYLNKATGSIYVAAKVRKALETAGVWGKYPFTTSVWDVQNSSILFEEVQKLMKNGALKKTDVVALATAFSCTKNK